MSFSTALGRFLFNFQISQNQSTSKTVNKKCKKHHFFHTYTEPNHPPPLKPNKPHTHTITKYLFNILVFQHFLTHFFFVRYFVTVFFEIFEKISSQEQVSYFLFISDHVFIIKPTSLCGFQHTKGIGSCRCACTKR